MRIANYSLIKTDNVFLIKIYAKFLMKNQLSLYSIIILSLCVGISNSFAVTPCPEEDNPSPSRWSDCYGEYTYPNGKKYSGTYKDGKRHGQGIFIFTDGETYDGEFENGTYQGIGTYTFTNGNKYKGEWKDGEFDGEGTFTFGPASQNPGDYYNGKWEKGSFTGKGVYYYLAPNGDKGNIFIGKIQNGKPNGKGNLTYKNGDTYSGEMNGGKPNGKGTIKYSNGDIYIGQVKNGVPNGEGSITFGAQSKFSGNSYAGEYRNGEYHGQGIYTWGALSEFSGDVYEGEWRKGKKNGQGIYTLADGRIQQGMWEDDKFKYPKKGLRTITRQRSNNPILVEKEDEENSSWRDFLGLLAQLKSKIIDSKEQKNIKAENENNITEPQEPLPVDNKPTEDRFSVAKLKNWWSDLRKR